LDEVDLILHPLKSELNFPKGEKFDLDVSEQGERWGLPIHLFDAIFFAQSGRVTSFEARGAALDILRRLESSVREGYATRSLQKLPHITLLNPTFYARKMKPILAEWAYLWLQKQHLHGIDREEAVKYVLSGAAARSEGKAKESLIEKALDDAALPDESKSHLQQALQNARKTRELTDALYEAEEQLESYLAASADSLAAIDAEIAAVTKAIKEAEYPRDDSLDNNVIVWYSQAFAPSHSAHASTSKLASLRALATMCSELESNGYTVKRCDLADEAAARVRELQANGHLRCVIVAGGEGVVGCSSECEDSHSGNCIVCGQGWGSHSGWVTSANCLMSSITNPFELTDTLALMAAVVRGPRTRTATMSRTSRWPTTRTLWKASSTRSAKRPCPPRALPSLARIRPCPRRCASPTGDVSPFFAIAEAALGC
jgi:hypothetical protein